MTATGVRSQRDNAHGIASSAVRKHQIFPHREDKPFNRKRQ
jgi:hypothetical protein